VLTNFMHVNSAHIGYYIVPFALGNFVGPIVLGPLFDRVGRRIMLTLTHGAAGLVLAVTAILFEQQKLSSISLTALWCVVFFFASAAASAAYLTVSEVFPLEIRAMAIAFFYAVGTGVGGIIGPALFGKLINSKSFVQVAIGFLIAAAWLLIAAVVTWLLAVDAEQKPLEAVAEPLSAAGNEDETGGAEAADEPTHRERREVLGYPVRAGAHWSPRYSFHGVARTNARHWGPGVARRALRRAVNEGRIARDGSGYVSTRSRNGN
jgi:MFS family permease